MAGPVKFVRQTYMKIKALMAFFATFVGQIVFFLMTVILLVLLAYIIFTVIAKDIAKLVGIPSDPFAAQSDSTDYAFLESLAESGYDSAINAEELAQYYGFEYAVLMDAARFVEDKGVLELVLTDISPVDCMKISREQWAWLNAVQFQDMPDKEVLIRAGFLNEDGSRVDGGPTAEVANGGSVGDIDAVDGLVINPGAGGEGEGSTLSGGEDPWHSTEFTTEESENEFRYEMVYNAYTDEYSVSPYFSVVREWPAYFYFLEDLQYNHGDIDSLVPENLGKKNRYAIAGGYSEAGATLEAGFEYIYHNIFALRISKELNGPNTSAFPDGPDSVPNYDDERLYGENADEQTMHQQNKDVQDGKVDGNRPVTGENGTLTNASTTGGSATGGGATGGGTTGGGTTGGGTTGGGTTGEGATGAEMEVDLYKDYIETLYYTVGDKGTTTYKIPLRVLLDRFLPNANLMASWRHLTDETSNAGTDIVNIIQGIYSAACLEEETGGPTPADMTNNLTFAVFERVRVESNLFRQWSVAKEDRYAVLDAFEGVALGEEGGKVDGISVLIDRTYKNESGDYVYEVLRESSDAYDWLFGSNEHESLNLDEIDLYTELLINERYFNKSGDKLTTEEEREVVRRALETGDYAKASNQPKFIQEYDDVNDITQTRIAYAAPGNEEEEKHEEVKIGYWEYYGNPRRVDNDRTFMGVGGIEIHEVSDSYIAHMGEMFVDGWYYAVVQESLVPYGREYGDLQLPTNAAPEELGGQSSKTDRVYFSLKELGYDSIDDEVEFNTGAAADFIKDELEKKYSGWNITVNINLKPNYAAVFPVVRKRIAYKQGVEPKSLPFYLVRAAKLWSSEKQFANAVIVSGIFEDPEQEHYLIHCNEYAMGYIDYSCRQMVNWRCEVFAPVFEGDKNEAKTHARETDVLMLISEWEDAADSGVGAADFFVRDIRALLNYCKGVETEDGSVGPVGNINPDSYEYLYIKDEIVEFDETLAEQIFWLNRLYAVPGDDAIDESTENKMKSRMKTRTWQVTDYELYDECKIGGNTYGVFALWPFGQQHSRTLYVIAANSYEIENHKIFREKQDGYGGYSRAHKANDLYGRRLMYEMTETAFNGGNESSIQASYSNGKVTLSGTGSTGGLGLYFDDVYTRLELGGNEYGFNGTQAAVYGYEIYQRTAALKDPKKAQREIFYEFLSELKWTEIRAIAPGIVTSAGGHTSSGFYVSVQHADGARSFSCHMKRYPEVQVGDYVGAGTLLGYEGTTGRSSGYHLHIQVRSSAGSAGVVAEGEPSFSGAADNPMRYFYPFFTPFYYAEKAEEVGMDLGSEYMATERTIFPYGQVSWDHGTPGGKSVEFENGIIKIKNYTPTLALVADARSLLTKADHRYVDYSILPVEDVDVSLGAESSGTILETSPCYFDEAYISEMVGRTSGDSSGNINI